MSRISLQGALTALITPFGADGRVDLPALEGLTCWQVERGIHGLVPCGTTGEGATLSADEHRDVVATVVRAAAGRVPVVAGCGSNDTLRTVGAAKAAAEAGADALLVVSPYYNKPNHSGMLSHFETVAGATDLPLVVYNVPGRTGQNLGAKLILELAGIGGVIGVKEASGDLDQISAILAGRPAGFAVLSGDDSLALPMIQEGAIGVISVASNIVPAEVVALVRHAMAGEFDAAQALHNKYARLFDDLFIDTNPIPVKAAMAMMGMIEEIYRLPMCSTTDENKVVLRASLVNVGVL